jgi:hypothetical protein
VALSNGEIENVRIAPWIEITEISAFFDINCVMVGQALRTLKCQLFKDNVVAGHLFRP